MSTTHFTMEGDLVLKVQNALSGIDQLQQKLTKLKLPKENESELTSNYKKLQQEAQNYINIIQKGFKTKQDTKELDASFSKIKKFISEYNNAFNNIDTAILKKAFDDINGGKISELNKELDTLKQNFSNLGLEASKNIKQSLGNIKTEVQNELSKIDLGDKAKDIAKEIDNAFKNTGGTIAKNFGEGRFDLINNNLDKLKERLTNVFKDSGMDSEKSAEFLKQVDEAIKNLNPDPIEELKQKIAAMAQEIEKLKANNIKEVNEFAKQGGVAAENAKQGFGQLQEGIKGAANEQVRLNSELDHLKSRIQYFFGLTNGVMLFRRALKQAVQTTKELDEVMTQTAVVSKNTVSDMWAKLPEYSKEAMKLGASIRDVYAAQTLYVQQGLEMDQAMKLGIETLKMARVAGLDAATATDTMTAALRGFKMELNEVSVQNINDVYSKLAQNTASNVQEISTAMSKVAALANSANMSFEGTAAYLAKIIESTREGAETAGTALKTVLARFTEVKKLYTEGELTGTDEEGQEVDVNKISKALRTAGIEMNSFFTGVKSMEEVLDELGEKWDSLTVVQQRYIATMAAGSRQQSRFLALMQDWDRTKELVNMAENAEGSGQEQFEKTLESLAVKITNLKNAWDTFIMGLTNNSIIKGAVDTLKTIIDGINNVINIVSGGKGLLKSVVSLGAAFGIFKGGAAIFKSMFQGLGSAFTQKGAEAGKKFSNGFKNNLNSIGKNIKINPSITLEGNDLTNFKAELNKLTEGLDTTKAAEFSNTINNLGTNGKLTLTAKEIEEIKKAAADAHIEADKLNEALNKGGVPLEKYNIKAQTVSKTLNATAMGITIAAGAFMTLSSVFDDGTEKGEKASKVLKIIGMSLLIIPPILKAIEIGITAVGTAAKLSGIIGWALTAVAAIAALVAYLVELNKTEPPKSYKEQLEEEKESLEKASEGIKKTIDDYKKLRDGLEDISEKQNDLDDLRVGTEEWDNAVKDLNDSISELIKQYPELYKFVKIAENGALQIDFTSSELQRYLNQEEEKHFFVEVAEAAVDYAKKINDLKIKYIEDIDEGLFSGGYFYNTNENKWYKTTGFGETAETGQVKSFSLADYARLGYSLGEYSYWRHRYREVTKSYPLYRLLGQEIANINDGPFAGNAREAIYNLLQIEGLQDLVYGGAKYLNLEVGADSLWDDWVNGEYTQTTRSKGAWDALKDREFIDVINDSNTEITYSYETLKQKQRSGEHGEKIVPRAYELTGLNQVMDALSVDTDFIRAVNTGEIKDKWQALEWIEKWVNELNFGNLGITVAEGYENEFRQALINFFQYTLTSTADSFDLLLQYVSSNYNYNLEQAKASAFSIISKKMTEEIKKRGLSSEFFATYLAAIMDNFESDFQDKMSYYNSEDGKNELNAAWSQYQEEYKSITGKVATEITDYEKIVFVSMKEAIEAPFEEGSTFLTALGNFDKLGKDTKKTVNNIIKDYNRFLELTEEQYRDLNENLSDNAISFLKDIGIFKETDENNQIRESIKDSIRTTRQPYDFIKNNGQTLEDYIQELAKGSNITVGNVNRILENSWQILARGGTSDNAFKFAELNVNLLREIEDTTSLEPEKKSQALNIYNKIDFSNVDSINKGLDKLGRLGVKVEGFSDSLIIAANAIDDFDIEKLQEKINNATSAYSSAKKGFEEDKRKYTSEEYLNYFRLAQLGAGEDYEKLGDWTSGWIQVDFDEWIFIGEETNSYLNLINEGVKQIIKNNYEEVRARKVKAESYWNAVNENENAVEEKFTSGEIQGQQYDLLGFLKYVSSLKVEDLTNDYKMPDRDSMKKALEIFDIEGLEDSSLMVQALQGIYSEMQKFSDYQVQVNEMEIQLGYLNVAGSAQEKLNKSLGFFTEDEAKLDEGQQAQIQTQNENALKGQAIDKGYLYTVEELKKSLEDVGVTNDNIIYALASYAYDATKKVNNLNNSLKDNWKIIKESEKETGEYKEAMNKLLPVMSKTLGFVVDSKFIKEHEDLFDNIVEGGEKAVEAWKELTDIQREKKGKNFSGFLTSIGIVDDNLNTLVNNWDQLNGSTLEVGASANFTDLFNGMQIAREKGVALAEYISSLNGMSAVWVIDKDNEGNEVGGHLVVSNTGYGNYNFNESKGGGGGGGGKKEFKNDFDKYYNMVEDINELERLRNLLETDYNQLLESENISGKAIYDNLKKQVDLLKERAAITEDLAGKREQQIVDTVNENKDLQKYAWWNDQDKTIEINWDLINEIKDSEEGDKVKEYVSKLEGFQSQYDEQIEALEDIESTLQEIEKRGQDQYISLEDRIRDALIKQIQDKIDEQTAVDEAINDTNQKLLDSIQKQLEQQRQERENSKTEEEIANKETRLAYLEQDSSGANAVEIANLQKEIAEARENYTDQLIDQKINELQEQNDAAAEQRKEQIDLMQESLEWQQQSGALQEQISALIASGVNEQGQLVHGSELENLLKASDTWNGLSEVGKMVWLEELQKQVGEAVGFLSISRQLENIGTEVGKSITFTNAEGKTLTGKVDKDGNVVVTNPDGSKTIYKNVYESYDGTYHTFESEKDAKTEKKPATGIQEPQQPSQPQKVKYEYKYTGFDYIQHKIYRRIKGSNDSWKYIGLENHDGTTSCSKCGWKKPSSSGGGGGGSSVLMAYATGGLNTKTGPAWLDGTPLHPELVLNARDTENFIQLKDTLSELRKYGTSFGVNGGDNYYDIDVHVDEIGSDYDVDKLADRLRTLIYKDGQYRNVNVLNRLR